MALINCPECSNQVSDKAKSCPKCGYRIAKKKVDKKVIVICLAVLFAFVLVGVIYIGLGSKINNSNGNRGKGFDEDKTKVIRLYKDSAVTTDTCMFTLRGYTINTRIEPQNYSGGYYYHYFEASSGNIFVDVRFDIKNLTTKDIKQNSVVKSVKLIYDNEYEYRCSCVTVDKDGDFESYTSLYSINPLETLEYHMMAEVPMEIKTSSRSLVVRVEVDNKVYECTLR